jgi:DNA polymerase-3 subunit delta'
MISSQKMPHAFLFYGEMGVGKKTAAKAFAKALVETTKEEHPDIRIYSVEEKSELHSIASIRELKEEVYLPPFESKRKVFIIHDAHKMLPASSQALLKTLEEPSQYCTLILIAEGLFQLLPTIVSRCCKMPFFPLQQEEIQAFLEKTCSLNQEEAAIIAVKARGSLERALFFVNQENREWQEKFLEFFLTFKQLSPSKIEESFSYLEEKINTSPSWFIEETYEMLLRAMRDLLILKEGLSKEALFFKEKEALLQMATRYSLPSFDEAYQLWHSAKQSGAYHVKFKTALETLLFRFYEKHARV